MSDENEEQAKTRLIQKQTCPCCRIHWATPEQLKGHLLAMLKLVSEKLASVGAP